MNYLSELLWYSIWPASIIVSYYAVLWVIKKYDSKLTSEVDEE